MLVNQNSFYDIIFILAICEIFGTMGHIWGRIHFISLNHVMSQIIQAQHLLASPVELMKSDSQFIPTENVHIGSFAFGEIFLLI